MIYRPCSVRPVFPFYFIHHSPHQSVAHWLRVFVHDFRADMNIERQLCSFVCCSITVAFCYLFFLTQPCFLFVCCTVCSCYTLFIICSHFVARSQMPTRKSLVCLRESTSLLKVQLPSCNLVKWSPLPVFQPSSISQVNKCLRILHLGPAARFD